ncbi:MAG: hypothetical protein IJV82_01960 [Oscillospiraceae bacterium]|nr:hypothetical protein [Oscillospiraceae bacterium]
MKRIFALFLALMMLLCACGKEPGGAPTSLQSDTTETTAPEDIEPSTTTPTEPEETEPSTDAPTDPGETELPTTAPTETTAPVEPEPVYRPDFGMYQPESDIEFATGGTVKLFLPEEVEVYDIAMLGDGILLFSHGEEDETLLTLCREELAPVHVTIPVYYACDDGLGARVSELGVSYYDPAANAVVFLDTQLHEVNRIELLAEITGNPMVAEDWSHIYYFLPTALMTVDVETGISRVRKECAFEYQYVTGLYFDGAVLECSIFDGVTDQVLYLSTETGETLFMSETMPFLETDGQWFFAEWYGDALPQLLFGQRGQRASCLVNASVGTSVSALPELESALLWATTETSTTLDYYHLQTGTRTASLTANGLFEPWSVTADCQRGLIWFLAEDAYAETGLYCWDPSLNQIQDDTDYTTPYYTAQEPDLEGLARIEEQADAIGKTYGVRIWVYEEAVSAEPGDFSFEVAYQVPLYEQYLSILEKGLASYPEKFLKKLGTSSDNGKITICLIGGAYGDNALGAVSTADGVQYTMDGNQYVGLVMNEFFESSLYHELFHIIDTYVFNRVNIYDRWDELNPAGFRYDNDYLENQYRDDEQYLEDETRAFIDMYSMSYAKEDRARIMEYAMQEGMEGYFISPIMQSKLKTLCKGIRKAFELDKYKEPLVWEQYLQ